MNIYELNHRLALVNGNKKSSIYCYVSKAPICTFTSKLLFCVKPYVESTCNLHGIYMWCYIIYFTYIKLEHIVFYEIRF